MNEDNRVTISSQSESIDYDGKTGGFNMSIDKFLSSYELEDLLLLNDLAKSTLEELGIEEDLCNEENLVVIHNNTKLKAPSYLLRFAAFDNEEELSDKGLHVLLEAGSSRAFFELQKRHGLNMKKLSDEYFVIGAQKNGNFSEERELLTSKYQDIISKIIDRVDRRYYFRGLEKDDLLQEAFLGFLKAIEVYKVERGTLFRDFSRHVIERHLGTLMKRSQNFRNKALNESFSYNMPVNSSNETTFEELLEGVEILPEELYIKKELCYEILGKLTLVEQEVLKHYSKGLTYKEIAEKVGKKKKSVDNSIQRLRNKGFAHVEEFFNEGDGNTEQRRQLEERERRF